jgi:hypothetical protein
MTEEDATFSWTTIGEFFQSLAAERCVVYKLVGTQASIAEYNAAHARHPPGSLAGGATSTGPSSDVALAEVNHWSALYTQVTVQHAEGTAGYRWDQGYPSANLLQLELQPDVLLGVCRGAIWSDGSVESTKKAELALSLMSHAPLPESMMGNVRRGNPSSNPVGGSQDVAWRTPLAPDSGRCGLMDYLGSFPVPVCIMVPETPDELEIIVPHSMVRVLFVGEKVVRRIARPSWAGPASRE